MSNSGVRIPETQAEFDAYVRTKEGASYIHSPLYAERWYRLIERTDAGEEITVQAAAEFLGLPVNVFRHILGHWCARVHMQMGSPPTQSLN